MNTKLYNDLEKIQEMTHDLCLEIDKLPASKYQTVLSLKASEVNNNVQSWIRFEKNENSI